MNLFIELHETRHQTDVRRFGTGWENLFTEQLAFFLSADLPAAAAYARLFLGHDAAVTGVTTQEWLADGTPDLRFDLADASYFYVEHKFESPLGERQLQRYLQNGKVALVSRSNQTVPEVVLASPDYLRPRDRHYFDWADVYTALSATPPAPAGFGGLRSHFLGYMRELGLSPLTNPEWGALFAERTIPENQRVQRQFGRLLDPIKHALRERGLRMSDVAHKGRQLHAPPGASWHHAYVTPGLVRADYLGAADAQVFDPGYEALMVELVFEPGQAASARAFQRKVAAGFRDSAGHMWYTAKPRILTNQRIRVSLATPLGAFLSGGAVRADLMCRSALQVLEMLIQIADGATASPDSSAVADAGPAAAIASS